MKIKDILKLSTRTFKTKVGRTALTILGTSIGIGAILMFVSLGYGLQKLTLEQITTSDSLLSLDVTSPNEEILLSKDRLEEISKIPNVKETSPLAIFSGQLNLGELTSGASFYACLPSYFRLGGVVPLNGKLFDSDNKNSAVLSSALLKSFNMEAEQSLGKEIRITLFKTEIGEEGGEQVKTFEIEEPYTISGIVDDETTSFLYIPLGTLSNLEINEYNQIKVKVTDSKAIDGVAERIVGMGYLVSALSSTIDEANKIFGAVQLTLAIFGLVALLVGAIGMANTMTVTLLERTNEIGVMKAIGAADNDIGTMFMTESVIMGFLGGMGGIGLGFLLSLIFNWGINMLAMSLGGQAVNLFYTPGWFVGFIVVFSTLVGFLSGIFPAKKAERLNPLEALRYK